MLVEYAPDEERLVEKGIQFAVAVVALVLARSAIDYLNPEEAHHLLEKHVLTKGQLYWKDQISVWYGQQMHEAMYLDPVMRDMEAMMDNMEQHVTGEVEVALMPYHFSVLGCSSSHDLMSSKFGSYGEVNKSYTGADVVGFTKVLANPLKIYYSVNGESAEDAISK